MLLRNLWCSFNSFYFIAEAHIHFLYISSPYAMKMCFCPRNCPLKTVWCCYLAVIIYSVIPLWSSWSENVFDLIPPPRFCFQHNSLLQSYHSRLLLFCLFNLRLLLSLSLSHALSLTLSCSLYLLFVLGSLHTHSWCGFLTHNGTENLCSLRYATASARTDGMFLLCGGRDASGTVSKLFINSSTFRLINSSTGLFPASK